MNSYLVTAHTNAPAAAVYRALIAGKTWPEWMAVDSYDVEPAAGNGPLRVGDVRVFRAGRYVSREPIVELIPDRRVAYTAENAMARDYRASIELHPRPSGGTDIAWYGTYSARLPGTGWLLQAYLRRIMRRAVAGLAGYAARQVPA